MDRHLFSRDYCSCHVTDLPRNLHLFVCLLFADPLARYYVACWPLTKGSHHAIRRGGQRCRLSEPRSVLPIEAGDKFELSISAFVFCLFIHSISAAMWHSTALHLKRDMRPLFEGGKFNIFITRRATTNYKRTSLKIHHFTMNNILVLVLVFFGPRAKLFNFLAFTMCLL